MKTLPFSTLGDDEVQGILSEYQIALTVDEARDVSKMLGRDPTLVEAVIWGIQGSEHCSYKSSWRFLKGFTTKGKHVILGPGEDSGIVAITDGPPGERWGFVVTHESHNHPSQIVPYEGAATGVGGTVRDVLCMGARVVGCMDMLRLGDLKTEESKTIAKEVVRGIGGYGNPLGIPNLGGDTVFDYAYNSNCLVNAIALGIVREDEVIHSYVPKEAGEVGYDIILIGKPTDRSGFGGASFASATMEEEKREQNTGAVQEPNPFLERHLLASTYALFDWLVANKKLDKVGFKDLGAGGVVCASVEQVADLGLGAEVDLDKVHVSVPDLPAEVIACAETQERLCWTCHPDLTDHILRHYNEIWDLPSVAENAKASLIGKVRNDPIYKVTYKGETVIEAKALDITCGLQYNRETKGYEYDGVEPEISCEGDKVTVKSCKLKVEQSTINDQRSTFSISEIFKAMLAHKNAASKAPIFVHYDKNVMSNTIVEPGEADASVIAPLQNLESYVHEGSHPGWEISEEDKWRGVAVSGDGNNRYGRISPYLQGVNATVESMRNVAAVGATPRAITDCLNYGNPEIPEQLWQLEQGTEGIKDASNGVNFDGQSIPIISGNVSLYNGKPNGSAIDPTTIVSCTGILSDARKAITMQIKNPDSLLFLIGKRKDECGGSLYYEVLEDLTGSEYDDLLGKNAPDPDLSEVEEQIKAVTAIIDQNIVVSCHDISSGGLGLTLFEMLTTQRKKGGNIGISVDLSALNNDLSSDKLLWSETGGFVVEVDKSNEEAFKNAVPDAVLLGKTTEEPLFEAKNGENMIISEQLSDLIKLWENGLNKTWN